MSLIQAIVYVVAYYRVSTEDKQGENNSIPYQRELARSEAARRGWVIVAEFEERYSAKTNDRPELNKAEKLIADHNRKEKDPAKKITKFIFKDISRFSRNVLEALKCKARLQKLGVEIRPLLSAYDSSDAGGKMLELLLMGIAESENQTRSENTSKGVQKSLRDGYWCVAVPLGFERDFIQTNNGKKPTLKPLWGENKDGKADRVAKAYNLITKGYSQQFVRRYLNWFGIKLTKSNIKRLLSNPVYIGKIEAKNLDGEKILVKGAHPPIVSEDLFYEVQGRLSGKKKKIAYTVKNEKFPLKGMVVCQHGNLLTGSSSKSQQGHYLDYYHSMTSSPCKCRERISTPKLDTEIVEQLSKVEMQEWEINAHFDTLRDILETKSSKVRIQELEHIIRLQDERLTNIQDQRADNEIDAIEYKEMKGRYTAIKIDAQNDLKALQATPIEINKYMNRNYLWIANLSGLYLKASPTLKYQLLGSILDEKIQIINKNCSNLLFNLVVSPKATSSKALSTGNQNGNLRCLADSRGVASTGTVFEPSNIIKGMKRLVVFDDVLSKAI